MVCLSEFKIGDVVHAKTFGHFCITDRLKPCEIIAIVEDYIKLKPYFYNDTFTEYASAFELFPENEWFREGELVTYTDRGNIATFKSYTKYGVKIIYNNEELEVNTGYVRKLIKGMKV